MNKGRDDMVDYFYRDMLKELFPLLINAESLKTFKFLIRNLNIAIENEISNNIETPEDDLSFYWRRLIDEDENFPYAQDIKNNILNALRDSLLFIGKNKKNLFQEALKILKNNNYSIYYRLELYIISKFPELSKDYVYDAIFNEYYFYRINANLEYYLLIKQFSNEEEIFKKYIEMVENENITNKLEPFMKEVYGDSPSNEEKKECVMDWRINRLVPLANDLSDIFLGNFRFTKQDLEKSNPLRLYQSKIHFGPISPIEKQELNKMSIEELIDYLDNFREPDDFFSESKTGLGRTLSDIVYIRVNEFLTVLFKFIESRSLSFYIPYILDGLGHFIGENKSFEWDSLFDFMKEILFIRKNDFLKETLKEIKLRFSRIINNAMDNNLIPNQFEDNILEIIIEFLKEPYPTQKDEIDNIARNWFFENMVINTIRGSAMDALISYGVWRKRNLLEDDNSKENFISKVVPKLKQILISHLDINKEKSYMIRYIYGMNFNKLVYLDEDFVLEHLDAIFPKNKVFIDYWEAAWAGYIKFNQPFKKTLNLLEAEYKKAVKLVTEEGLLITKIPFSLESLTKHIMTIFANSSIDIDSKDFLVKEFFIRAPENFRSIALIYIGQNLNEIKKFENLNIVLTNLKNLWVNRLEAAKNSEIKYYSKELLGFSYWFTNSIFEEKWVINKLYETLELTEGSIGVHYDILDKLLEFVDKFPIEVIKLLNLIIKYEMKNNGYLLYIDKFRLLIERVMISNNQEGIITANQLINYLGANNIHDLKDLIHT